MFFSAGTKEDNLSASSEPVNSDPLSLTGSQTASAPKPKSPSPVKKLGGKAVGGLGAGLMINPQALLPGAAPPKAEPVNQAIGFDIPAENTNVLHSVNKVGLNVYVMKGYAGQ